MIGWLVGLSLGICLIYMLFYLAGNFDGSFFVLSNKNMVSYSFSSNSIVSAAWDPIVWAGAIFVVIINLFVGTASGRIRGVRQLILISVLCSLSALVLAAVFGLLNIAALFFVSISMFAVCFYFCSELTALSRFSLLKRVTAGCVLAVILVELAALLMFNLPYALNLSTVTSSAAARHWQLTELCLSNLTYPLLPYAYLFFIVLGIGAFIAKIAPPLSWPKLVSTRLAGFTRQLCKTVESLKETQVQPLSARFPLSFALLFSFIVSTLLVVITVLPWINPTNRLISVDGPEYYKWLDHMRGLDVNSALSFAFVNDRTVFLVLSYALSFVVSPVSVIQFIPALLIPLFCIVSLFMVKLVCGFREVWVYAVLLVPFSIQALGLIYSGYYANMLAVIFVSLFFIMLLKVFPARKSWGLPVLLILSVLILLSHSWTWYIFVVSLGAFLLLEWRRAAHEPGLNQHLKWKVLAVATTIIAGLTADFSRNLLTSKSASLAVFETAQSHLGLPDTAFILSGLKLTTNFYLGGVFSGSVILTLCIVGFFFLLTFKSEMSNMLIAWFLVGCVAVLFASGEFIFNRFMFLTPSVVFSSLGLSFLIRYGASASKLSRGKRVGLELLIVCLVFLVLLNFALRYTCNVNIF